MAESCRKTLEIEVPPEVVKDRADTVAGEFRKRAKLPGFRPGKAPLTLIQQRFGDDIRSEVLQALVPELIRDRLKENNWEPVGDPAVSDVQYSDGAPLKFKATLEVLPEIALRDYAGLSVDAEPPEVTEAEVEKNLEQLRERAATYVNLDPRPLQDGDYASISIQGVSPDKEAPAVNVDEILCEIGGTQTVKEFSESLRGAQLGEERQFEVPYAEDFSDARLAGKKISYQVKVLGLKKKLLPDLDDEFARDAGSFESLEDLRRRVREEVERARKGETEQKAKNQLREELAGLHDFPVPEALVERQMDRRVDRLRRQLAAQGVEANRIDWGRARAAQREEAAQDVKVSLILEKIAEQEKISIADADVKEEIEKLTAVTGEDGSLLWARLTREGGLDKMKSRLRVDKALDLVFQNARTAGSASGEKRARAGQT